MRNRLGMIGTRLAAGAIVSLGAWIVAAGFAGIGSFADGSVPTVSAESLAAASASAVDVAGSRDARGSKSVADSIVGTTPPEWQVERWLNSPPLRLADLRGKVVLVRWWTAGCAYCANSAPALREFHQTYGPRGLVVIGLYHHKGSGAFNPRIYEEMAKELRFTFPLAVDTDWRTLESWARDAQGRAVDTGLTSMTFVLDKKGVVRHVHAGGEYFKGDAAYEKLRSVVEGLIAEN